MGGGTKTQQKQRSISEDTATQSGTNTTTGYQNTTLDPYYNGAYKTAQGNYNTLLGQAPSTLSTNTFSDAPNAFVQGQISRGQQNILGQANQANARTSAALNRPGTGNNSALLGVLQRQSQISNAGAMNGLAGDAVGMQLQYDQEKNAANATQNANNLAAYNTQLSGSGNLLSSLNSMAQAGASKTYGDTNTTSQTAYSKSTSNQKGKQNTRKSFF